MRTMITNQNNQEPNNDLVEAIQKSLQSLPEDNPSQIDLLSKTCTVTDVTAVIIFQINGLVNDIKELEEYKENLKNIFPADTKSYRNSFVIENKTKIFVGFFSTILEYKRELNSMLLKLRAILDVGTDLEKYKQAIREVIVERSNITMANEDNKKKIDELLKKSPGLMPSKM